MQLPNQGTHGFFIQFHNVPYHYGYKTYIFCIADIVYIFSFSQVHENFFSVIKTLIVALGHADPCLDMKKYANGLKPIFDKSVTNNHFSKDSGMKNNLQIETVSRPVEHQVLIQSGSLNTPNYSAPTNIINLSQPYSSKLHSSNNKDDKNLLDPSLTKFDKSKLEDYDKLTCRILILFSEDGTESANQAVELARTVTHEVRQYLAISIYLRRINDSFV